MSSTTESSSSFSYRRSSGDTVYGAPAIGAPTPAPDTQIREKLAALLRREEALRLREVELERAIAAQRAAYDGVQRELRQTQDRLESRSRELDAQAVDLVARSARLAQLERDIQTKTREHAKLNEELHRQRAEIHLEQERARQKSAAEIVAERAALQEEIKTRGEETQRERTSMLARIGVIRQREQDLESRVKRARDEIVRTREALTQERQSAEKQRNQLQALRESTEARRLEVDRLAEGHKHYEEELQRRITEEKALKADYEAGLAKVRNERKLLDAARARLDGDEKRLLERQQAAVELDHKFESQRRELEARAKAAREAEASLQKARGELEVVDARQNARKAELDSYARRLREADEQSAEKLAQQELALQQRFAEQERGLQHQYGELEQALRVRQDETEAALRNRQAEVDATFERVNKLELEARDLRNEAQAWKEQLEAKEAEARQTALTLEIEKQQLDQERAQVALAVNDLDSRRVSRETELQSARTALRGQARRLLEAQTSVMAAPQRWALRGGLLAAAIAALVGGLWYRFEKPSYRGTARLEITSESNAPLATARQHAAALWAAAIAGDVLPKIGIDRQQANRALAIYPGDAGEVKVELTADRDFAAEQALKTIVEGYAKQLNSTPATTQLPSLYAALEARRRECEHRIQSQKANRDQFATELALQPDTSKRPELLAQSEQLEKEHTTLMTSLEQQRAKLANLLRVNAAHGTVTPGDLQNALVGDETYAEDRKELRVAITQYRTEFSLALKTAAPLLTALDEAVAKFRKSVQEQRDLKPSVQVAAILENCSTRMESISAALKNMRGEWDRVAGEMPETPAEEPAPLVKNQIQCADGARHALADSSDLYGVLRKRVEDVSSQDDGGPRNAVIATVLRGDLGALAEAIAHFKEGADALDLLKNFRLDAQDRQVRGVTNRLEQRKAFLKQQLEQDADRRAREQRDQELAATRTAMIATEDQRDAVIMGLTEAYASLRRLDEAEVARQTLSIRIAQADDEIAGKRIELKAYEDQLAEVRRSGPKPDRAAAKLIGTEQIAGTQRIQHAALAAAAAFAGTFVICLLMILRLQRTPDVLAELRPLLVEGAEPIGDRSSATGTAALSPS